MIPFNLCEITPILKANHVGMDCVIHTVSIDSKCIDQQCMFIALLGERFDGHDFAKQAVAAGAKALLVDRYLLLDVPQLIVMNTRCALIELANWVCQQASVRVIAITGSSGKTSVKEMTASILEGCGRVVATQNNLNNTVGVPVTLLRLTKKDDFAVVELGVSVFREIDQLIKVIVIDVALVNNIFPSHISGFGSLITIKREKGKIFLGLSFSGIGIINLDNHALFLWDHVLQGKTLWKFSVFKKINADFFASDIILNENGIRFILHDPYGGVSPVFLPMLLGYHNVANALAASTIAFSVGASLSQIVSGLENLKMFPGRLFPIILGKGKLLIDDTYNSNVGSMLSAIRVLSGLPGHRILITSDMLELGDCKSVKYHCYIGKNIAMTSIDQVLTVGDVSYFIFKFCKKKGRHFNNKIELIMYLKKILSRYELVSILVKGSRNFAMEQIVYAIKDHATCYFG